MNKNLPLDRRIHNAYGSQECERLHAIHQNLIATERLREEYVSIWDKTDACSWGFNWGQARGFREMWYANCNALCGSGVQMEVDVWNTFPETASMERSQLAFWEFNELNSGVVEMADDGKSCRAAWMCHGMGLTRFCADDRKQWGCNTFERYGSDFIYDEADGHWKYLHEQICSDFMIPCDRVNWANEAYVFSSKKVPAPGQPGWDKAIADLSDLNMAETGAAAPEDDAEDNGVKLTPNATEDAADCNSSAGGPPRTGKKRWHLAYGALQPVQRTCPPPEPYVTLDHDNSYVELDVVPEEIWKLDQNNFYELA